MRSFGETPGKREALLNKLVKISETPVKREETPEKGEEPVFIAIPAVRLWTPYTAVAFEFVNTDSLGELCRKAEMDELKDRLHSALRNEVAS